LKKQKNITRSRRRKEKRGQKEINIRWCIPLPRLST